MNEIIVEIKKYFLGHGPALEIFERLIHVGDVYVMGGLLREYLDHGCIGNLRDADFTVLIRNDLLWQEMLTIPHKSNRFNGCKYECGDFYVDVWDVRQTWAFDKKLIKIDKESDYFDKLPDSVFLNLDGLVYDLTNSRWNDDNYRKAMKNNRIDVVLEDNPFIDLNIVRAIVLGNTYGMDFSDRLREIIYKEYCKHADYCDLLYEIQSERYVSEMISRQEIERVVLKTVDGQSRNA